jgi:hypothetical protein
MRDLMFDAYIIVIVLYWWTAFDFTSDGVWDTLRFYHQGSSS